MKNRLVKILLFTALIAIFVSIFAEASSKTQFDDVSENKWYYSYIESVCEHGIMIGKNEKFFAPDEACSRAQFVTILARLSEADISGMGTSLNFSDTDKDSWYADAVGWAVSEDIVTGYEDGTFKPSNPVLRQELAVLFDRYLKYKFISFPELNTENRLADADVIPNFASDSVQKLYKYGIITGDDNNNFNPEKSTLRSEIAAFTSRYMNLLPSAIDSMYERFDRILELVPTKRGQIELTFGSAETLTNDNFSNFIVPAMGLDIDTYELVMDESELEVLRSSDQYGGIQYGEFYIASLTISIKNKITNETTDPHKFSFWLNKVYTEIYVDPDDFDPGIDPELYKKMMETSLYSTGDIARLAAAFEKTESGEELTVAYIGGSITEGATSDGDRCWAKISYNWMEKHYPNATVNYVNAGIGGTPSILGNIRLEQDVLSYNPDIVFVEFAVNDTADGNSSDLHRESFESLVRSTLESEGSPAVVIVLSAGDNSTLGDSGTRPFMKKIAENYNLPVIDVQSAVWQMIDEDVMTIDDFLPDSTHPHHWGHQIMSDMVEYLYKTIIEMKENATDEELRIKPVTSTTITNCSFMNMEILDNTSLVDTSYGSWENSNKDDDNFPNGWMHRKSSSNDPMEFTVKCKNLFIISSTDTAPAEILVTIDGQEPTKIICGAVSGYDHHLVFSSDTESEHTVSIKMSDSSISKKFYIYGFGCN